MASGEGAAEKGQRSFALMEDGAEADAGVGGIAVHHERAIEVWHLEHGPRRERPLEGLECLIRLRVPGKSVTAEKARQWRGDEAEVSDVLPVVAGETQEAT
jgi:hypothetical protein